MGKPDEVVKDMTRCMVVYGGILQIVCFIVASDLLKASVGLWIGVVAAILMLRNMRDSLIEALDLGEAGAQKYIQKSYAKRYLAVVIVFLVVSALGIANVLTLLAGVMGLKVAAYLQPIIHKNKIRKGGGSSGN